MDVFSNLMVIGECLLDVQRTRAFERAIARVVRPGQTVLDVGTGSGVLAMFAARAGASRVLAIDIAPDIVGFASANIANNGLDRVIEVRQCDGKRPPLCEPMDVITLELMDTWLVAEQQAAVLNELHACGAIGSDTTLIPYQYQCLIELVEFDFSFYGFRMPFVIQARNFGVQKHIIQRLSAVHVVQDLSFNAPLSLEVERRPAIPLVDDGFCNAAVLTARTFLAPDISVGSTTDMNMPVIVPLPRRCVRRGESVALDVNYVMGSGFGAFEMKWDHPRVTHECPHLHVAEPPGARARLDAGHPPTERIQQ